MSKKGWTVVFVICIANFLVFWVAAVVFGGDALAGKAEGDKFFLSNHGKLTEVSREVFVYSRYHTLSVWITHPMAFFAGWRMQAARNRSSQ